jgi:hypothetical protein
MDRASIERDLVAVQRRVAETEQRIRWHCERIKSLQERGLDATFDRVILEECQSVLALHSGVHARLIEQLIRTGIDGPS